MHNSFFENVNIQIDSLWAVTLILIYVPLDVWPPCD